ncbi:MAG: metallophosphoesterase [Acidobacteriota bacterium]
MPYADARRGAAALLLLALLLLTLPVSGVPAAEAPPATGGGPPPRIVAVADIHGALDALKEILRETGLIDRRGRWIGGDTTLVQTGDMIDRGADSLATVDFLMDLQREAPQQGGEVIVLLGNHEILNLVMDLRDVTPRIARSAAGGGARVKRIAYCNDLFSLIERQQGADWDSGDLGRNAFHARCVEETPRGLLEYIDLLGPDGRIGRWLRQLPAVARIGDWLFLHGGISPELAGVEPERINGRVEAEIAAFDDVRRFLLDRGEIVATSDLRAIHKAAARVHEAGDDLSPERSAQLEEFADLGQWWILDPDGPLWFRGYAYWTDDEGKDALPKIFGPLGIQHAAVGHTPQKSRTIEPRFDGRIFLLDTGMLESVYGGRPAALDIRGERIYAVYRGGRERLAGPAADAADAER